MLFMPTLSWAKIHGTVANQSPFTFQTWIHFRRHWEMISDKCWPGPQVEQFARKSDPQGSYSHSNEGSFLGNPLSLLAIGYFFWQFRQAFPLGIGNVQVTVHEHRFSHPTVVFFWYTSPCLPSS